MVWFKKYLLDLSPQASGFCWCVEEDTGRPIEGTSVQYEKPSCGAGEEETDEEDGLFTGAASEDGDERPWRKCPNGRRKLFRKELMQLLKDEMGKRSAQSDSSLEDRAVEWKFADLDRNNDQVWQKGWRNAPIGPFLQCNKYGRYCREESCAGCEKSSWVSIPFGSAERESNCTATQTRTRGSPFKSGKCALGSGEVRE